MSVRTKFIRRASLEELNWIHDRLVNGLETKDVIFSVEKILSKKVMLHVRSEGELFSVNLRFDGKFERPVELGSSDIE